MYSSALQASSALPEHDFDSRQKLSYSTQVEYELAAVLITRLNPTKPKLHKYNKTHHFNPHLLQFATDANTLIIATAVTKYGRMRTQFSHFPVSNSSSYYFNRYAAIRASPISSRKRNPAYF